MQSKHDADIIADISENVLAASLTSRLVWRFWLFLTEGIYAAQKIKDDFTDLVISIKSNK